MRRVQEMSVTAETEQRLRRLVQLRAHSRVHVVLRVDVSLDLGFHVAIGVGRLNVQQDGFIRQLHFTTHTQYHVQSSFSSLLLDVVVRLCPVIVHSICMPNSCIFHIAKTGLLKCCLYTLRSVVGISSATSDMKRFDTKACAGAGGSGSVRLRLLIS